VLTVVCDSLAKSTLLGLGSASKLKKNTVLRKPSLLLPTGKEAPKLVYPRDRAATGLDVRIFFLIFAHPVFKM
jgi:hypothetical protein